MDEVHFSASTFNYIMLRVNPKHSQIKSIANFWLNPEKLVADGNEHHVTSQVSCRGCTLGYFQLPVVCILKKMLSLITCEQFGVKKNKTY